MDSWPNQEALNKALNIYRTYMRSFIIFHLKKIPGTNVEDVIIDSVSDWRADEIDRSLSEEGKDIKDIIDIDDFPLLVVGKKGINWKEVFRDQLNDDKEFQNQLWLIKTCRDQSWAHPPEGDAESEGTRAHLFLIADVLGKIKRTDKQHEVEIIRDDLFSDDTAERLAEAEECLKDVEAENAEYKKSLTEVEKHLETEKSEKIKYEEDNATLSKQIDEKEKRHKKLSKQLKNARLENDKYKKNLAGTKKRLENSEKAQVDYKKRLQTTSKELKDTKDELAAVEAEKDASEKYLAATRNLLTTVEIGDQTVFPPLGTDTAARILDRRNGEKKNYLLNLLEQKQPTIIYVQSEEKIDQLLTLVGPEKAKIIGKHHEQTSETEETEILEKLENGEFVAIVSNTTFPMLTSSHSIEHFVFCHLVPGLDTFFERCQPAFTSEKNNYLHLIYDSEQDIEGLTQKYPDRAVLEKLYPELKKYAETNGNFIKTENLYSELDIVKLGIETGLAIFEELQLLERNEEGINLLTPAGKKLDESEIYRKGEKLKKETADFQTFQHEYSIEQIWEKMLEKLNVNSEQILHESSNHKMPIRISETEGDYLKDSQTQSEQSTEVVEKDNGVSDETAEAKHIRKSPRANAKVTEEQVREIRSRSAAGESYSKLSKEFGLTPTGIRNIVLRNTWKHVE